MEYATMEELAKAFGINLKGQDSIDYEQILNMGNEVMKQLPKVNIVITGKTGVGKSTLINATFRQKLAETGMGRPVTRESQWLFDDASGFPLRIYDTVGLELSGQMQQSVAETVKQMIRDVSDDPDKMVHCVWYCVAETSDRFEQTEEDFIREIVEQEATPVVLVLTKAYRKKHAKEFRQKILEDYPGLPVTAICPVLALDEEEPPVSAYGLDALVEKTAECLPEDRQISWCNAQAVSLKMKKERATAIVRAAVVAAGAIGLSPVPVSDAVLLVPNQVLMLVRVTNIFGFPVNKKWIMSVVGSLMGTTGATFVGRMVVSNLLKLVPGLGTVAGGTVSGATAALLTLALGSAYIRWMEYMFENGKGDQEDWLDGASKELLVDFFKEAMKTIKLDTVEEMIRNAQASGAGTK